MIPFEPILARAIERRGESALRDALPMVRTSAELAALPDGRYLSLLCLRIFRAGIKHSVVDQKWPAFEAVFHGFVPDAVAAMTEEDLEPLMGDTRLIRHWGKLKSVPPNASALRMISAEAGGFGRWLASWPAGRTLELWEALAQRFSQFGGDSAPRFLRMVGRDTFIFSPSVEAALQTWGVTEGGKGKAVRARAAAQFDDWAIETGRPFAHLSMILAYSVPE
ncbi:MAG TPA: DNA-3-methyladenine glycosylase I [Aliidongia sp.]|uniref:DNA-3-methyladenine glycosylase I n=1 Tax=Aliidongia sp. TaxID=1914230 RepID=UPI002DDCCDD4|nr:DNA-3-methyladenine glycosylase I [Aliidongia sp.]HEV2677285.1 DNA-3-methyladenine glycosylase I [Aliidongia sp.]